MSHKTKWQFVHTCGSRRASDDAGGAGGDGQSSDT